MHNHPGTTNLPGLKHLMNVHAIQLSAESKIFCFGACIPLELLRFLWWPQANCLPILMGLILPNLTRLLWESGSNCVVECLACCLAHGCWINGSSQGRPEGSSRSSLQFSCPGSFSLINSHHLISWGGDNLAEQRDTMLKEKSGSTPWFNHFITLDFSFLPGKTRRWLKLGNLQVFFEFLYPWNRTKAEGIILTLYSWAWTQCRCIWGDKAVSAGLPQGS